MTKPETVENQDSAQRWRVADAFLNLQMGHLWLAVPFLLVIWISSILPLPTLDFWWHLKCGQIIWESHSIPTTDIFSYTAAGKTYILQNWLGEVIFYWVYRAGGPALVIVFNTLLLLLTLAPIYYLCLRYAGSTRIGVLSACVAAIPLAFQGNIRPQVFSFLMFAWFYLVLREYQKRNRHLLWLLPVLMALWVNLHGAFVLGILLIVVFLGLQIGTALLNGSIWLTSETRKLMFVLLVTGGATLLNPQLTGIYKYVVEVANDPVSHRNVIEWMPPRPGDIGDVLRFLGPFFFCLFVLVRARRKPDIRDVALFIGAAAFAFMARRNSAWFVLVAAPILAPHLTFGSQFRLRHIQKGLTRGLNLLLAALLLAATVLGLPWFERLRSGTDPDLLLLDAQTPVRAADFMLRNGVEGRVFHPQHYGDYLIWRLWPRNRTFFDGRVHLFSPEIVDDYFAIRRGAVDWEEVAGKYQIRYLLLDRNDKDEHELLKAVKISPRWELRYEDRRSVLFALRVGELPWR